MAAQKAPTLDDLLPVLNAATDNNALRWTETAEEDTFRAEFGPGLVRVAKDGGPSRYSLTLVDQAGTVLEEYQPSGEGTLLALENLYKKVRRHALDLDGKLHQLFETLKSLAGRN